VPYSYSLHGNHPSPLLSSPALSSTGEWPPITICNPPPCLCSTFSILLPRIPVLFRLVESQSVYFSPIPLTRESYTWCMRVCVHVHRQNGGKNVAVIPSILSVLGESQELELVAGPPAKQPRKFRVCESNLKHHWLSVKPVVASHHLCGLVGLDLWFEHIVNTCIVQKRDRRIIPSGMALGSFGSRPARNKQAPLVLSSERT